MEKAKDAVKRQLKEQWEQSCNGYLVELLRMWELDFHYGYWIGDETGGVYDYGDGMFTINMDDIIYCVLADVTREQYQEWQEYICDASEFGFDTPNLRSFVRGCPRTSAETFKHLRELKAMLNDAIQDEKERVKNNKESDIRDTSPSCYLQVVDNDEFSPVQRCGVTFRQMPDGGTEYHATTNGHEEIERGGTELMHAAAKCYTDFRKEHPEVTEMRFYTDELVEINGDDEEEGE